MNHSRYNKKTFLLGGLLVLLLSMMLSPLASAQPTVSLNPEKPYPQSTVTFTANIGDIEASEVCIIVQECNGNSGIWYPDKQNASMTSADASAYEATITLRHDDATYLQYTLLVHTSEGWDTYLKETKVYLSEKPSSTDGDSEKETPGFEFVAFASAIMFISLILYKRR